jgi:hypothetical protein
VWQDARFSGGEFDSIAFSQSLDGGLTWSEPIKVNLTPTNVPPGNQQAFTPSVQVAADGTVGVTYYDFRNNTAAEPLLTDYFLVHCHPEDPGGARIQTTGAMKSASRTRRSICGSHRSPLAFHRR